MLAHVADPSTAIDVLVIAGDLLDIAGRCRSTRRSRSSSATSSASRPGCRRWSAPATTTSTTGPRRARRRPAGSAEARAHGVHVDGDSFDSGRLAADRLRLVGGSRDARRARGPARRRPRSTGPSAGCGRSTVRPRVRCRGPGPATTATPSCPACSTPTAPTSCCAGTSTRRRSPPRARGPSTGATPGCSTPATSAGRPADLHRAGPRRGPGRTGGRTPGSARSISTRRARRSVVGRAVRAPVDVDGRAGGDAAEQLAEHAEVVVAVAELALHVDDVGREPVEPAGQLAGDLEPELRGGRRRTRRGRRSPARPSGPRRSRWRCGAGASSAPVSPTKEPGSGVAVHDDARRPRPPARPSTRTTTVADASPSAYSVSPSASVRSGSPSVSTRTSSTRSSIGRGGGGPGGGGRGTGRGRPRRAGRDRAGPARPGADRLRG